MKTYIVLFRGINVGGNNLLPMKVLRSLLEKEGCENVRTYIQSGNAVFRSKSFSVDDVSSSIESRYGFKPTSLVLEARQLESAISNNPYKFDTGKTVHFFFCAGKPVLDKERVALLAADDEAFELNGNVLYLYAPSGIGRSKLVKSIESCLGVPATGRNLNTVLRLQAMAQYA